MVSPVEGTFGEGDDAGETIGFETAGGARRRLKLAGIHALSFLAKSPDWMLLRRVQGPGHVRQSVHGPPGLSGSNNGFIVTQPRGSSLTFLLMLSKLDYSQDKLV